MGKREILTPSEFVQMINSMKGCQFASISYQTETAAIDKKLVGGKSNAYNGKLSSITEMCGVQIGANYENAVNNRTEDGTEFTAEKLPWGEWLRPNYLIGHKGNVYLRAYKTKASKTEVAYYLNGSIVESEETLKDINANIRSKGESKRQSELGIDAKDQVKPFNVNVANIKTAVIDGTTYIIAKVA